MDPDNGLLTLYGTGYIENKLAVTEEHNTLKLVAGSKLSVYVNDSSTAVACTQDGNTYYYDLSAYVGQTVKVKCVATDLCAIVSANLEQR